MLCQRTNSAFDLTSMNARNDPRQWRLKTLPKAPNYFAALLSNKPRDNAILVAPANSDYVHLRMRMQVVGYA